MQRADSPRRRGARVRFPGTDDDRLDPEDSGECPQHAGHDARACERCDWEPIELALDEALEAFDALEPLALPARHEDHDLPIAAE
jgi:hypothetical protein